MSHKFLEKLEEDCRFEKPSEEDCQNCEQHDECCDHCDKTLDSPLYCFSCEKIQKQQKLPNYFRVFSLDPSYKVDTNALNEEYDRLVGALHPDFHYNESITQQTLSLDYTTMLNDAKKTLEDPFQRGKYLLSQIFKKDDTLPRELPQEFIMEMFELQEQLDELEASTDNQTLFLSITVEIARLLEELEQELDTEFVQIFEKREQKGISNKARLALAKLNFVLNLKHRLAQQDHYEHDATAA